MAKMYYDDSTTLEQLEGKKVAVLGYGSQGHAHALNLRDSKCNVVVGLHQGSQSKEKAEKNGLTVASVAEATKGADVVMMLTPDTVQAKLYHEEVKDNLKEGAMLMFAHGFNIRYSQIVPPANVDVTLVAPKAPGHRVRELFMEGVGTPGLLAVYQDYTGSAYQTALAYAKGIGCTKAGVIETTFKEETETDLFGEQAVLCGGISHLIKAGFDTLVEAGYQPEIAYFECLHEAKLIVDLIQKGGLSYMRYSVSDTAEHGDYTGGPRVVNDKSRQAMKEMLTEIQDGTYARNWILENQAGRPCFNSVKEEQANSKLESVGKDLRKMMPWL